jgi:site-specific DNA-methyltransferase (adenine-specific)
MSPYYEHAGISIYLGDCREILPGLGKFDLLLTDPPYGVNVETAKPSRQRPAIRRGHGARPAADARRPIRAVLAPRVFGDELPFDPAHLLGYPSAILWGANHYAERLPSSPMWLAWDRESDGTITDAELAWVRGHRFKTVRLFRHKWSGILRASEQGVCVLHPTQKPVALMRWCLGFFPEAQSVIDPYMGSGPVARACKDAGKRYVGIEIEERYAEIAAKRLAQEVMFA